MFDLIAQQWGERTLDSTANTALSATIWDGTHVYSDMTSAFQEQTTYAELANDLYGMDVETCWIKMADLLGGGRLRQIQVLGEWRSDVKVRVRIAYDYNATYVDDLDFSPTALSAGNELYFRVGPSRQQCRAIKIRLTAENEDGSGTWPLGEALKLTGLAFEVGLRTGLNKRLASAQKVG